MMNTPYCLAGQFGKLLLTGLKTWYLLNNVLGGRAKQDILSS